MNRRWQLAVCLWLVCSIVLAFVLREGASRRLSDQLEAPLTEHLRGAFDESFFSSDENRVNDNRALARVGAQVNRALQNVVRERWYAPRNACAVQLQQVDGVELAAEPAASRLLLTLPRNGVDREVMVGVSCAANLPILFGASALLGALFLAIYLRLPAPLSATHRRFLNDLLGQDYSPDEAFEVVSAYPEIELQLNESQAGLVERLHQPATRNMVQVLELVTDAGVAALTPDQARWFALGYRLCAADKEAALAFARHPDGVEIDLPGRELRVRGWAVPTSATPLFYYAWYALRRLEGDGWVTNPPSNRPDRAAGSELAQFMARYDGHAKAVRDLEQSGLKARTLDQNRSKIKDELVAVLGEELAAGYLFEARKHADGVQMSYRLALPASCVNVLS
ncbi:MAG: hypothetical protein Hals2KO_26530 [Halioglobus sp.]